MYDQVKTKQRKAGSKQYFSLFRFGLKPYKKRQKESSSSSTRRMSALSDLLSAIYEGIRTSSLLVFFFGSTDSTAL